MANDTRPTTLTFVHNYNLRNQGWPNSFDCSSDEDGNSKITADPVTHTKNKIGVYPSNSDILYAARTASAKVANVIDSYSPWQLKKNLFGNTPAPKGHFIINAFDRNRTTVSGIDQLYDTSRDKETDRPVSVQFYAGRVFYCMPNGKIFYSQILLSIDKASKCYQENDPTGEDITDLLDTDGGSIIIDGLGELYTSIVLNRELVLLADNGVWTIGGGSQVGFTAADQEVKKISSLGVTSRDGAVLAEDSIYYFGKASMYRIAPNQYTGALEVTDIAQDRIQAFYNAIPEIAKNNARGFYDRPNKKILWFYNDTESYNGVSFRYRYNKVLILDIISGAYTKYSHDITDTYPFIVGMMEKKAVGISIVTKGLITSSGDNIKVGPDEAVATFRVPAYRGIGAKLVTIIKNGSNYNYTFSEYISRKFKDWPHVSTGVDYSSYLESGNDTIGDPIVVKFGNLLYAFFEQTEEATDTNGEYDFPSSCLYRIKWNWSDSVVSGKWSDQEQLYKLLRPVVIEPSSTLDYGFSIVHARSQIRGNGRSLSIRFESESGKDFRLLGWAIPFSGATSP